MCFKFALRRLFLCESVCRVFVYEWLTGEGLDGCTLCADAVSFGSSDLKIFLALLALLRVTFQTPNLTFFYILI